MAIAVVHRLLAYYAELVHARRADDTAYKQRRPKKDPDSKKTPDFKAIVKYIALKTRQVPKKFFEGKWDAKLHEPEKKGTTISLSAGKRKAMVSCTRNEFRLYAREWHKLA
jgi:hypothetical protein